MTLKHSFEYVQEKFQERRFVLLENEYINSSTKMKYIYICGNESFIRFSDLQKGINCQECRKIKRKNKSQKIFQDSDSKFICDICDKRLLNKTEFFYHKREKHTRFNCEEKVCVSCLKNFYSDIFHKKGEKISYTNCEECRELQKTLNTNFMKDGSYVYNENKRYLIQKGKAIEICPVYDCFKQNCDEHKDAEISFCKGIKCLNGYVKNGFNFCPKCRYDDNKAKNKIRQKYKDLKIQLGGKCVNCGETDLFKLEFDHIDESLKTKQITRMNWKDWDEEIKNIQLLCGICHRIKNLKIQNIVIKLKTNQKNIDKKVRK